MGLGVVEGRGVGAAAATASEAEGGRKEEGRGGGQVDVSSAPAWNRGEGGGYEEEAWEDEYGEDYEEEDRLPSPHPLAPPVPPSSGSYGASEAPVGEALRPMSGDGVSGVVGLFSLSQATIERSSDVASSLPQLAPLVTAAPIPLDPLPHPHPHPYTQAPAQAHLQLHVEAPAHVPASPLPLPPSLAPVAAGGVSKGPPPSPPLSPASTASTQCSSTEGEEEEGKGEGREGRGEEEGGWRRAVVVTVAVIRCVTDQAFIHSMCHGMYT